MAVCLKRSEGVVPPECPYGCCTPVYGKNVRFIRRTAKRRSRQDFKRSIRNYL